MKIDIREIIKKGIPLVCGACAAGVVKTLLKDRLPESDKLVEKAAMKVGVYGIGLVVTAAVSQQVEREVNDFFEIIDPFTDAVKRGIDGEKLSQEDIQEVKDAVYADEIKASIADYDGAKKEQLDKMAENLRQRAAGYSQEAPNA